MDAGATSQILNSQPSTDTILPAVFKWIRRSEGFQQ